VVKTATEAIDGYWKMMDEHAEKQRQEWLAQRAAKKAAEVQGTAVDPTA
jgi:hypothetical protein